MKKELLLLTVPLALLLAQCHQPGMKNEQAAKPTAGVGQYFIQKTLDSLINYGGEVNSFRMEKGVKQCALLWRASNGDDSSFMNFCLNNFLDTNAGRDSMFVKLSHNTEILSGNFLRMILALRKPLDLDEGNISPIDLLYGGYDPSSHMLQDFFDNQIAFITALNFPFYNLDEKMTFGPEWTREQWGYTRLGDLYTARVPANLLQDITTATTSADTYISEYNIYMGRLVDSNMKTCFPAGMKLISHWGLRDEIKSNYRNENGLVKQEMIYEVMKRIIDQSIPQAVINNNYYRWEPYRNIVYEDTVQVDVNPEPDTRYSHLLDNFRAVKAVDPYEPYYPTFIERAFDKGMELHEQDVEKLFTDFLTAPVIKQMAALIRQRLGRDLKPFDIWYNGFKPKNPYTEEQLDEIVRKKYPNREAFESDLPNILMKMGFSQSRAHEITSHIQVDASRGAGHAWGAGMTSEKSHLRTRFEKNGMNYKSYNIAIHEFGHTVEQTITLHDVDYYILSGVPNTAFTEALAFLFQKQDLDLLGIHSVDTDKEYLEALDNCWSTYEIMGVSLVDMNVWKWMYAHPDATPAELKEAVISIAKDIWNTYYAPVLGMKDEPILAIYSHMIDNPLYLPAYPVGHLIDYQIERYLKDRKLPEEIECIYTAGDIIPELWMEKAVGSEISAAPTIQAAEEALKHIGE